MTYMEDKLLINKKFLWKKKISGIVNIASGKKTNLKTVAKIFARKLGKEVIFNE